MIRLVLLSMILLLPPAVFGKPTTIGASYKGWIVRAVRIEGIEPALARSLRKGLALAGTARLIRPKRATFYPKLLADDLSRTRLFLAQRGYPAARVSPRLEPNTRKRQLVVILDIAPGPPVRVDEIELKGFPSGRRSSTQASLPIRVGDVLSDHALQAATGEAEASLHEAGYARASVEAQLEPIDSTTVKVLFLASPDAVCYFGNLSVEGPERDLASLARRSVEIRPGERYAPEALRSAEENLRMLDIFQRIRVSPVDSGSDTLDVLLELTPRKQQFVEAGVGYWTDDLFRAHARWGHKNLFRRGRGIEARGSYSRYDREIGSSFRWLTLFGSRTSGAIEAKIREETEETYGILDRELRLSARHRHSFRTFLTAAVAVSSVEVDVKTEDESIFEEEGGLLTVFSADWSRDASDDRLYPTRGTTSFASLEWSPPGHLSDSHFLRGEASTAVYVGIEGNTVIAARLSLGAAAPIGASVDLLPNKRFYAGGATSMRGFKRRKLGPLDQDEAALGGEAKLLSGLEIRFPIVWRIRGAAFLDAGQVWLEREQVRIDQLEVAAGPALMVQTPVGPVRADLGFRLTDREPSQPRQAFHIAIGHPF
jgi:outer membrane protein assembly complex protein YaeT